MIPMNLQKAKAMRLRLSDLKLTSRHHRLCTGVGAGVFAEGVRRH